MLMASLLLVSCGDQLAGGVISKDGELGLGDMPGKDNDESPNDSPNGESAQSGEGSEDKKDPTPNTDKGEDNQDEPESSGPSESKDPTPKENSPKESPGGDSDDPSPDPEDEPEPEDPKEEPEEDEPKEEQVNGELKISFSTQSYGGRYGPRNVGAVWVESSDGTFLRSLKVWAQKRAMHLVKWRNASKSDKTDAITRATVSRHQEHQLSWDRKDRKGKEMGVGDYRLHIEITEENSASSAAPGPTIEVPFHLGGGSKTIEVDDSEGFKDVKLATPD